MKSFDQFDDPAEHISGEDDVSDFLEWTESLITISEAPEDLAILMRKDAANTVDRARLSWPPQKSSPAEIP